jgi:hypothetical protein
VAGCAAQTPPPKQPSPSARCREQIEAGFVYAGQSDSEFLERCGPVEASQVGHLRLYNFVILRGYEGLMVIAKEGRLVRAFHWTDYGPPHVYFDTMSEADRQLLKEETHLN